MASETGNKLVGEIVASSVQDKLGYMMMKANLNVDCKFIVGANFKTAETMVGHKWMFAVESEVFERLFYGEFMEAKNSNEITLPDDDPAAFRHLRRLLYNTWNPDTSLLNFGDTISLYNLCDKYMVKSVSKICSDHLKTLLEDMPLAQLIILFGAASQFRDGGLLDKVNEKLFQMKYPLTGDLNELTPIHFTEYLLLYAKYNGRENHVLLFRTIEIYLTVNDLIPRHLLEEDDNINSKTTKGERADKSLQKSSEKYDMECEERKRELWERLLSLVDFGKMTNFVFVVGPGKSKILTWQQKYLILSKMAEYPCANCYTLPTRQMKLFY